jgi:hypothetical protein
MRSPNVSVEILAYTLADFHVLIMMLWATLIVIGTTGLETDFKRIRFMIVNVGNIGAVFKFVFMTRHDENFLSLVGVGSRIWCSHPDLNREAIGI